MVLVDTSVWINHLGENNPELARLLNRGQVLCHPFIIGELACGNMKNRSEILSLLSALPPPIQAEHEEVMHFIENNKLMGKGLGFIDFHLAVSAYLTGVSLWTLDKKLQKVLKDLGIDHR
jgi:predicted nucleic acid-binding protein